MHETLSCYLFTPSIINMTEILGAEQLNRFLDITGWWPFEYKNGIMEHIELVLNSKAMKLQK